MRKQPHTISWRGWSLMLSLMLAMGVVFTSLPGHAQAGGGIGGQGASVTPANANDSCTNFATAQQQAFSPTQQNGQTQTGLLSDIYNYVKTVVGAATQNLFMAFINSPVYQDAIGACFALAVVFYGVAFTMGIVQISFGDVLKRLIKIGVVATLVSPTGWSFFSGTIVSFFNDGTDQLVNAMIAIGTGTPTPVGATPFYQFDQMAAFLLQPDTLKWMLGFITTGGPYGLMMAGLGAISFAGFLKLLVDALKKYAYCYVARSMLLGLAPIFLAFLLFDRTKQLFSGWVNTLVGFSIRPILMFLFLSFYIILLQSAAKDMLSVDVCWTDYKNISGTTNSLNGYRFKDSTGAPIKTNLDWKGWLSCTLNNGAGAATPAAGAANSCPEFPVNIVDILTFLILVYIAIQFSNNIESMSDELSNSMASIESSGSAFSAMLRNQTGALTKSISGLAGGK